MNTEKYKEQFIELGLAIKHYRIRKGLTQEQLAEKIHISPQQISRIESPKSQNSTTLYTLFLIADALEVDVAQLFSYR